MFYPQADDFLKPEDAKLHHTDVYTHNLSKNQRLPQRLEMPIIKKRRLEQFETLELPVPINAEEICAMRYGPNYMTPDPSWHWENEKNTVVEWHEMIPKTIYKLYPML